MIHAPLVGTEENIRIPLPGETHDADSDYPREQTSASALYPVAGPVTIPTTCAWCLAEAGTTAGEGSHGICRYHAAQLLALHRRKRGRVAVCP